MKQTLQLKLSQHLTLTPQLQQSIRLLQLSTMELNQELEKFLAENPLLEREDTDSEIPAPPAHMNGEPATAIQAPAEEASAENPSQADIFSADTDWGGEGGSRSGTRDDADDGDFFQVPAESPNLREHLHRQLSLTKLEPRDRNLVAFLIEALDEGGYLTQSIEELAQLVPEELQIGPEELAIALKHLQNFDPTGVGARNCAECLELQLLALPESTPSRATALAIAHEHLELLAARDFSKLRKALQCGDDELRQAHFFEHGEVGMRPLVLREIANTLGLHESTVSRVTTQKFMFTPRGIFELKYFFGSHVATETGGACSATAIRALIKQLVAAEDARKPLSDSKISDILSQQGIVVARRTIAKYRESLQIPSVSMRKSL